MTDTIAAPRSGQIKRDPATIIADAQAAKAALNIAEVMEQLESFGPDDTVKSTVYKIVGGKYETCFHLVPPFNDEEIFNRIQEEFGPGAYEMRVFANGRIFRNVPMPVARPKFMPPVAPAAPAAGFDMMGLMTLMMTQAQQNNQQQMQMFMQMSQSQTAMLTAILPALAGGKDKLSDVMGAVAALQTKPEKGGGVAETLELLAAAKGLVTGDDGGFDADALGGLGKLVGPLVQGLGRIGNTLNAPPQQVMVEPLPQGDGQVRLIPQAGYEPPADAAQLAAPRFPGIAKVREDVLFCFSRRVNPETAADLIADALDREDVGQEEIDAFIQALQISPDPLADLAADGIDLRADPIWAGGLVVALQDVYADAGGGDGDSLGGSRSEADPAGNGPAIAPGLSVNAGEKRSRKANATP